MIHLKMVTFKQTSYFAAHRAAVNVINCFKQFMSLEARQGLELLEGSAMIFRLISPALFRFDLDLCLIAFSWLLYCKCHRAGSQNSKRCVKAAHVMTLSGRLRVSLAHPCSYFQDRQKTNPIQPSWRSAYNVLQITHINKCMQDLECSVRNENASGFYVCFK